MDKDSEIVKFLCAEIASVLHCDKEKVTYDSSFMSLGMHSMAFVELLISIEKQYGVKLLNSGLSLSDLTSVSSLAARISASLEK